MRRSLIASPGISNGFVTVTQAGTGFTFTRRSQGGARSNGARMQRRNLSTVVQTTLNLRLPYGSRVLDPGAKGESGWPAANRIGDDKMRPEVYRLLRDSEWARTNGPPSKTGSRSAAEPGGHGQRTRCNGELRPVVQT